MKDKGGGSAGIYMPYKTFAETFKQGFHSVCKLLPNRDPILGGGGVMANRLGSGGG